MIPLLPFCLYVVIALFMTDYLRQVPRVERQGEYAGSLQSKALNLSGFSFTAFSFMVGAVGEVQSAETNRLFAAFGVSVVSFLAAYMGYQFRTRECWFFFSDAALDNGIWCIVLGLFWLSTDVLRNQHLETVFLVALVLYWSYMLNSVIEWLRFAGRWPSAKSSN